MSKRITVYFLIIMLLTAGVSVTWNFFSTRQAILDMEEAQAEECMEAVSTLLDHYWDSIHKDQRSEEYTFLWRAIRNCSQGFAQDGLYIYSVNPVTKKRQILMIVDDSGEKNRPKPFDPNVFPLEEAVLGQAEEELLADSDEPKRVVLRSRLGTKIIQIGIYKGYSNEPGPVFLAMEYNVDLEKGQILRDFLADIILPISALALAFLVLNIMIHRRVTVPIRLISDRMKRFARNTSEIPEPLHIDFKDEIGEIASSFEKMTEEISSYISNIEKLTKERVENDVQLNIARRIQMGMVPERASMCDSTFRISAMTQPAKAVGGDFYDCFRRKDGAVCIVMGDVSGKGISGAIFMAMTKNIIREKLRAGLSPAKTLNEANTALCEQNPEGLFVTVFTAILDPDTGLIRYANAGHDNPVILSPEASFLEMKSGIVLGLFEDADIEDETMTLRPGQGMILYTDGVTEAINAQHDLFGPERLLEAAGCDPHSQDPAEDALMRIRRAVEAHSAGVEPFDDMAILVLFMNEVSPGRNLTPLAVSFASFDAVREAVIREVGDTQEARMILLAADEALANIVRYSGATELAFEVTVEGDVLGITFRDNGIPFDPTVFDIEVKEFEELDGGGMGLGLIRQSVSSARYVREDGRNLFSMQFLI